ncbi:hypothetical protein GCM10015536_65420 [Streptomyces griseomycini]|nr:hypothetical protein GCM10015536_65420 [Streptomyces griseomycini]
MGPDVFDRVGDAVGVPAEGLGEEVGGEQAASVGEGVDVGPRSGLGGFPLVAVAGQDAQADVGLVDAEEVGEFPGEPRQRGVDGGEVPRPGRDPGDAGAGSSWSQCGSLSR